MLKDILKNTKVNFNRLVQFGFSQNEQGYQYTTTIVDNQFDLVVTVDLVGQLNTKVIDKAFKEEYVLHLMPDAVGGFVGSVRAEYIQVLQEIRDKCCDQFVFKTNQAQQIINYIRDKYADELEFLWAKTPNNAIWRRKDNKKWYAALLTISKSKLGLDDDEQVEIIDLRVDSDKLASLVDNKKYFEGYHMNKKHWITICLNDTVDTQTILDFVDDSYILAGK